MSCFKFLLFAVHFCLYAVFLAWYGIGMDLYPMDDAQYAELKKNRPSYASLCDSKYRGEIAVIHFLKIRNESTDIGLIMSTLLQHASHPIVFMPWIGKLGQGKESSENYDAILVMRHRTVRDLVEITTELENKGVNLNVAFEKNEQWVANGFYVGWLARIFLFFLLLQIFHCLPYCCRNEGKSTAPMQRIRK